MPNYLEMKYGRWRDNGSSYPDNEAWHEYPKDPQQAYAAFHERVRETENNFVNDGKPADGRQLLDEIRTLSDTRHDVEIEEPGRTNSGRSYRYG